MHMYIELLLMSPRRDVGMSCVRCQAIHENLPTIRFVDPTMVKTALALEWLTFSDTLMGAEHHGQVQQQHNHTTH